MTTGLITLQRNVFHRSLIESQTLSISPASKETREKFKKNNLTHIVSNADIGNQVSINIALGIVRNIAHRLSLVPEPVMQKKQGQTLGNQFEDCCRDFIAATFLQMTHLRPGTWYVKKLNDRTGGGIGHYEQYAHLNSLEELKGRYGELKAFLGDSYTIAPDVVILREPEPDSVINQPLRLVDDQSCNRAALRAANHAPVQLLLHASLSCKFTMRSDRAQNSRTEALNLLRSRKGRAPHIAVITAEPTPNRIASLALGTGDIDCVYHFALYELRDTLIAMNDESALDLLDTMISGKRLKDISDLPLDLAI